jgi:hypothetical protein
VVAATEEFGGELVVVIRRPPRTITTREDRALTRDIADGDVPTSSVNFAVSPFFPLRALAAAAAAPAPAPAAVAPPATGAVSLIPTTGMSPRVSSISAVSSSSIP